MKKDLGTEVLHTEQIKARITRIAWQILEEYQDNPEVCLVGISGGGYSLAGRITEAYNRIAEQPAPLYRLHIDKKKPLEKEPILEPERGFENQNVVLVDDVLHSGKTLIYGVSYLLKFRLQSLTTAVLVDRNHKRFPVKVDFKGLSLSTAFQDHVKVHINEEPYSVVVY